jgi:pectin methylesterase-like acyl-CoA thioesterase
VGCYIQAALDDAPQEAEEDKYIVHVLSGVYNETVNITRRNVMLISDGVGATCRRSETGGSLSRRVNVAACPSPDGSSARVSVKGGERGGWRPA